MEILGWILFAVLIDIILGIALGKVLHWSASAPRAIDEPQQNESSEPYPRWEA